MAVRIQWFGDEIEARGEKAIEQATLQTLLVAKSNAKALVHRLTGTLSRSIHVAPLDYGGYPDEDVAKGSEVIDVTEMKWDTKGLSHAVGSWIGYAKYEERRPGHSYLRPAFDEAVKQYPDFLKRAMKRQGIGP